MRADRLLSLLLMLQSRGRLSARRLAEALEVSERTIYRDVVALSTAGVPVFTERGPGGGVSLVESYRTSLTGLTRDEIQALFILTIPTALDQLGIGRDVKNALLKLSANLPAALRDGQQRVRQRIYLDSTPWTRSEQPLACLPVIQQAIWNNRRIRMRYRRPFSSEAEGTVEPYGLVAKANVWHLVFALSERLRVIQVSEIITADLLEETFDRPSDLDLQRFWEEWLQKNESRRPIFTVTIRAAPGLVAELVRRYGARMVEGAFHPETDSEGWQVLELHFETFISARERLLGFGAAVEVLEPEQLRLSMADFGRQIAALYSDWKIPG